MGKRASGATRTAANKKAKKEAAAPEAEAMAVVKHESQPASESAPEAEADAPMSDDSGGWDDDGDDYLASDGEEEEEDDSPGAGGAAVLDDTSRAAAQEAEVAEVSGLLGVSHGAAGLLLRWARWDKSDLLTRFMEDAEKVCRDAGVAMPGATAALVSAAPAAGAARECMICREDATALSSLDCGHAYCDGCWVRYLGLKVEEGETQIRCPEHRCPLRVPEELVRRLCSAETVERYTFFLRKSFVDHSRTAVWCPVAGCSLAVDNSAGTQYVTCGAGHAFCTSCNQEPHAPASCDTVKSWLKKCDDDSETFNWLSINTQDCPKCKSTIEKNGGCNHMTCKQCKHEYCWVCLGDWAKHSDFYNCNRFDQEAVKEKEASKASTRAALERYVWHFHRFANHENSRKLESSTRVKAEAKIKALQEAAPSSSRGWGDVAFVQQGTEEAIRCRSLLKWTYVLAFALTEATPEKELFLFLQQELESRTERLSGLLESDAETLLQPAVRSEILALVSVAAAARKKLLKGVSDRGLDQLAPQGQAAGDADASGAGAAAAAEGEAEAPAAAVAAQ